LVDPEALVTTIEFGTKTAADSIRDEYDDHLCSDDDRRLKKVVFASDTPERVVEEARQVALDSRAEGEAGAGQAPLSDTERGKIDFSKGRANVPWARSIKAIAADEGVSDWTAYVDPSLTVDEHREVMAEAALEGGGRRQEDTETATEKAGRASRTAQAEGCDHARDHCENGDTAACEFLQNTCGYDESEVSLILGDDRPEGPDTEQTELVEVGGERGESIEVPPEVAGALSQSWQGYKGAVSRLSKDIGDIRKAVVNARQATRAINSIRKQQGQEPIHMDRLHELLAVLDDMPGSIPETRTLDHFGSGGTDSEGEAIGVEQGMGAVPIGEQAAGRDIDQSGGDWSPDVATQSALDTNAEKVEQAGEDQQVTLAGGSADDPSNRAVPATWTRNGTNWEAGPYSLSMDSPDGRKWDLRLYGDGERVDIAQGVRDASTADRIAQEFTDRLAPDEVSFHSSDAAVMEAAAAAKKAATETNDGGLSTFS